MASKLSTAVLGNGSKDVATEVLQFLAEAAYLWYYRGQFDNAVTLFKALAGLIPNSPVGHSGLGEVYLTQGKFREAEKSADQATRAADGDRRTTAFAYKLRGRALVALGRGKDAEKALQRAVEGDAGGPEGKAAQDLLDAGKKMGIFGGGAPGTAAAPAATAAGGTPGT